ncbi:MAG TPA: DUF6019 family protein [Streptosporangiaceae bacterium]|jgi:uncharacterized membrane protein YdjX (TVP38/TMEM64 family)|nr:DUF6019 family protein [Streptosporangiaceae bacterium]
MGLIVIALLWVAGAVIGLVILYYVIRTAVRDGIMDAWTKRGRVEREAAAEEAVGWDPYPGRGR